MLKNSSGQHVQLIQADQAEVQIASGFFTTDNTAGTAMSSPKAYGTATIPLVVPPNAVELILNPSTDLRVSDVSNLLSYDVIAATSKEAIGCAKMGTVYIKQDSTSGTVNFRFSYI